MQKNILSAALISAAVLGATAACSSSGSTQTAADSTPTSAVTAAGTPSPLSTVPVPSLPSAASSASMAPQSWFAPAQLPFDSSVHWTGGAASAALSGTTVLSEDPIVYPCANHGYQVVAQDASGFKTNTYTDGGAAVFNQSTATQSYLAYASATAAQSAFQAIKQDLTGCSGQVDGNSSNTNRPMSDAVKATVSTADSLAYTYILRDDQGQPAQSEGNYGSASDYHTYVVVNGSTVEILWLRGGAAIDDSTNDAAVLQTLASTLS